MELSVDWTTVKNFASTRNISLQWILFNSNYFVWAIDGNAELCTQIPYISPTPSGSDQLDFETNYQTAGNESPRGSVVQVLGSDTLTLCPFGAFSGTTLQANATTNWDIPLPENMTLRGANMFSSNAQLGDWISVTVIDKTNITGQGGTTTSPTLLGTYVISWFLVPGLWNKIEDVSISETIPAGVFLRVTYTSTGSTPPTAILNLISYVGTP